jgi:NitT/TauT family transport system ATP-binding protein
MLPKISLQNVGKAYGGRTALSPVSFQCQAGSFTCLLGPSGCGKSTIINMIAGFTTVSSGQILVDGVAVTGAGADRGVVFQEYGLFPWRTAQQNVMFGPMIRHLPRDDQAKIAQHYLQLVGLADYATSYPSQLSGGMQQRVAIARALANGPSILLMDEPFGALDAQTRETMQEELLSIWQQERKTVVFVTHSISEALFLADQIVVMATKPGAIRKVFDISLEHPRDRTDTKFIVLEREIRRLLREEVKKLGRI